MTSAKEQRKRTLTSRLEQSDESITKKLKMAQEQRVLANQTSKTSGVSQTSTQRGTPDTPENHSNTRDEDDNTTDEIHVLSTPPQTSQPNDEPDGDGEADVDDNPQAALGESCLLPVNFD